MPRTPKIITPLADWHVYILRCANGTLYTGITNNLERRLKAHKSGRGSWFTRVFGAEEFLYTEKQTDKIAAFKREREIKSWPRTKKVLLIEGKLQDKPKQVRKKKRAVAKKTSRPQRRKLKRQTSAVITGSPVASLTEQSNS